ncbi:response regulator transcription factor [Reichenbachiella sp. MALMAid0571]|uniref:LytR/AlgR family response regulator transcription factor n=1 Tax=Reichenbachiella sp. MALMAid0571 TaxID=3143939 RepID=UPI0032DF8D3C
MKLKCIVIDDEQLARKLLEEYIGKIPGLELVGQFKNPLDAITALNQQEVDLIFLDIQMPDLTGLEFLKTTKVDADIIFTTAYSEYALEGYSLDVTDYLLKPFPFDRFVQSVNKAIKSISLKRNTKQNTNDSTYITVNSEHKTYKIILDEIDYIEGLKEYVSFYVKGKRIISLLSLKHLEDTLPSGKFLRVHKSYIIPVNKVEVLEGNQLKIKDKLIPIGRSYKDVVHAKIFKEL